MVKWIKTLGIGLLAGLVAALFMTVVMVVLRLAVGIPLPAELGGDRFLPYINVTDFLAVLGQFGGPIGSKRFALLSSFEARVIVGMLIGALYAAVAERGRSQDPGRFDITRRGGLFLVVAVGMIWLVSLGLFSGVGWPWSVLSANFRGIPPGWASVLTALGLLVSYASYGLILALGYRFITGRQVPGEPESAGRPMGRRAFLVGAGGVALALASDGLIQRLLQRSTLPYDGMTYLGTGIQPITPNDQFYIVTKNIIDPYPWEAPWRLRVSGQVERPHTYDFEELSALPSVEQEMTLGCISNPVGGGLMSNAVWRGVPLPRLIEAASPKPGTVEVRLRATDDYVHTVSFEKAMEETTLVAYEMNGVPLPQRHGYPVRILVPGYYGEASVKWVTSIELLDNDEAEGYYGKQGWEPRFVHTFSRVDQPRRGQTFELSQTPTIPMQGVAFAGDRGISGVEVSTDGGESWQEARITYRGTQLTWVFWSYEWRPQEPGDYELVVRATDGTGELQTEQRTSINPDGATGYHRITTRVMA